MDIFWNHTIAVYCKHCSIEDGIYTVAITKKKLLIA